MNVECLRACAHCSQWMLAYSTGEGRAYYCPRCRPTVLAERERDLQPGGLIRLFGSESRWIVQELDTEARTVTVVRLGFPGSLAITRPQAEIDYLY